MGCLASKDVRASHLNEHASGKSFKSFRAHSYAVDGPPAFGVESVFEVCTLLGEGMAGQTWLCRELASSRRVAIKFIERPIPLLALPMLKHEIKIQSALGSGHISLVSAKEVILTPTYLCIVMEYAPGGNLTQYVNAKVLERKFQGGKQKLELESGEEEQVVLSEDEARFFFKQYLAAVEFLHRNKVAHRDLKLDNIVLDGGKPARIKLCDFGFAKNWDTEANMLTQIGTPVYMSPQLISTRYSKLTYDAVKADIYACGVGLFVMLLGVFPYDHTDTSDPNTSATYAEVQQQHRELDWRQTRHGSRSVVLSQDCQDLLDKIFEKSDGQRISIEQIKQHPWYCQPLSAPFQAAWDSLQKQQALIDEAMLCGGNESNIKDDLLERMLEEAGPSGLAMAAGTTQHIDLILVRRASELQSNSTCKRVLNLSPSQLTRVRLRDIPDVSPPPSPCGSPSSDMNCLEPAVDLSPLSRRAEGAEPGPDSHIHDKDKGSAGQQMEAMQKHRPH